MRGLCGMRISKTGVARSRRPGHLCGRIFDVLHALDQAAFRTTRSTTLRADQTCSGIDECVLQLDDRQAPRLGKHSASMSKSGKLAACEPSQAGSLTSKRCTAARVEWINSIVEIIPQTGLLLCLSF